MTIGRLQTQKRRVGAVTKPTEGSTPVDLVGVPVTFDGPALVPMPHTHAARHWIHEHRVHISRVRVRRIHMPHVAHVHLPHLPPVKPEKSLRHYQFLESALMSREMDRL